MCVVLAICSLSVFCLSVGVSDVSAINSNELYQLGARVMSVIYC